MEGKKGVDGHFTLLLDQLEYCCTGRLWGLLLGDISISTEVGQGPESLHLNLIDHFTYVILSGWSANRSNSFTLTLGALFRHSEGISSIQLVNMSKFRFCKLSLHVYSDK